MIIPQDGFTFQVPSISRFVSREVRSPTAPPAASADAALPSAKDATLGRYGRMKPGHGYLVAHPT